MKKFLVVIIIVMVLSSCVQVRKYNHIYAVSRINNVYELYSGVVSYRGLPIVGEVIEYQIHPVFTGTKAQCKEHIPTANIILEAWIEDNFRGGKYE